MENIAIAVVLLLFVSLIAGAIYLLYRAVRCFRKKGGGRGVVALIFSLMLGFAVIALVCALIEAREMANRACCGSDLKQLGLFLKMYAADHQESYPPTFNGLVGTNLLKAGDACIFVCPSSHKKVGVLKDIHSWTDYAYVSGLTEAAPLDCIVAFCSPENHQGEGANVAFLGGKVKWYSCRTIPDSHEPTFHDLTNTPTLFYGTTNEVQLADLMKRTRIIYPRQRK